MEIPFAFDSLPQTGLDEFTVGGYVSTRHKRKKFLWDYNFVLSELNPALKGKYGEVNEKYDNILSKTGINSLDYLILQKHIDRYLDKLSGSDLKKKLLQSINDAKYPKGRDYLKLNDIEDDFKMKLSLVVMMDYASAASFNSFESLEKSCEFYKNNDYDPVLNYKQEFFSDISNLRYDENPIKSLLDYHMELRNSNRLLTRRTNELNRIKKELVITKKGLKKIEKKYDEILNSTSWKVTKPLRSINNHFK